MSKIRMTEVPILSQKWVSKNDNFYLLPTEGVVADWVKLQSNLFEKVSPRDICNLSDKITPYNTVLYFNQQNLTGFGGYPLVVGFMEWLGVKDAIEKHLKITKRQRKFSVADLVFAGLDGIILGMERIWQTNKLKQEKLITNLRGIPSYPDQSTLNRHINSYKSENIAQLDKISEELLIKNNQTKENVEVVVDFDSTVATVYGKQEGAEVGYNPKKKGRPSYSIIVSFLGNNGDCIYSELRGGNMHCSSGFENLFEETKRRLPENYEFKYVRFDKGLFSEQTCKFLEGKGKYYIGAAKATGGIKAKAQGIKDWIKVDENLFVAEMRYKYASWEEERKIIVKREILPNPDYDEKEAKLFPEEENIVEYSFYVTNIEDKRYTAYDLLKFYDHRAIIKNRIKEAKLGFNLDKLPSSKLVANKAYVKLVFLAYNLLNWFKRFMLPSKFIKHGIRWLRHWLIEVPAIFKKRKTKWCFYFPSRYKYKELMLGILKRLSIKKPYYVI